MKKLTFFLFVAALFTSCNKEPVAMFEPSKNPVYIQEPLIFQNQSTDADSYLWDFGDNTESADIHPTHNYSEGGTKTVILTATGKGGVCICINKVNVYNGKSSYQVENNTTLTLKLSTGYWDGNEFEDFVLHGDMDPHSLSDTVFTSRDELMMGGQLNGETFIVVSPYSIIVNSHNILEIKSSTNIYGFANDNKSANVQLEKLGKLLH